MSLGHSSAKRFCKLGIGYDDVPNVHVNIEKENESIILPHKVHAVGGREQQWRNCTIAQLIAGVGRKPPILHSDEFPDIDTSTVQMAEFASECGKSASGQSGESASGGVQKKRHKRYGKTYANQYVSYMLMRLGFTVTEPELACS